MRVARRNCWFCIQGIIFAKMSLISEFPLREEYLWRVAEFGIMHDERFVFEEI